MASLLLLKKYPPIQLNFNLVFLPLESTTLSPLSSLSGKSTSLPPLLPKFFWMKLKYKWK
ncbi:hypothetical protein STRDD04_00296 [Streptococcus sp. DD04]|nr:hypothetical protein STRDD04_00296 [Streptococcus sp. DD04]